MATAHERAVNGAMSDDFDPVAAYADGYQQAIDPGWPSPDHLGTNAARTTRSGLGANLSMARSARPIGWSIAVPPTALGPLNQRKTLFVRPRA